MSGDFNDFATDFLSELFDLSQKIHSPTRGDAILDKIFIDSDLCELYEGSALVGPPIKNSDHFSIFLRPLSPVNHDKPTSSHSAVVWDFRESFLSDFVNALCISDFKSLRIASSVDEMVALFYSIFWSCAAVIPRHIVTFTKSDKLWMTPILKFLIQQRWSAFRRKDRPKFNHYKEKVKHEIAKAKRLWRHKKQESTKGLWDIVREMSGKNVGDPLGP